MVPEDDGIAYAAAEGVFMDYSVMHDFSQRRQWQPTPVLLPGESPGRGSLVGCCLWGYTESDTTKTT